MSTYEHIFLIFCFSVKSQETYSLLYWFLEKGSKKRIILQNFVIDVEKIDDQKTSEQNEKDSNRRVCITIQLDYCREWCCCHHSYQSFQRKNPKTLPTEGVWLENWSEYLLKILFSSFVYQNKIFTIWKRKFCKFMEGIQMVIKGFSVLTTAHLIFGQKQGALEGNLW